MIKYTLLLLWFFTFNIHAQTTHSTKAKFSKALASFKLGKYQEAIDHLDKIKKSNNKSITAQKHYLMAIMNKKLQLFEKSIPHFKKAIAHSHKAKDIYYEYAQALLANNELETARRSFIRSYKLKFERGSSLYYMAYISQLLNQPKLARAYYRKVISSKTPQKALLQGSTFQIAETNLELGKKKKDTRRIVKKYVLPQLKKAYDLNPQGTIATDIQSRIFELQNEFDLDPLKMVNGRKVSSKKTTGNIELKLANDNNITNEDPTTQTSNTASLKESKIYQIEAYVNRRFIFSKRFIISPDIRWNLVSHSDKDSKSVWANDSYTINPTLRTLTEHTIFSRPASFILDFEFNYLSKAHTVAGERNKDSTTTTFNIGERFSYFSFGETTFKYSKKSTTSAITEDSNNNASTISIDQIASIGGKHLLILLYQNTSTDFEKNITASTKTNLFRMDYIKTNLFLKIQFQAGLSYTKLNYTDSETSKSKGSELTTSPTIKLSKTFYKHYKFSTDYTYTKVSSEIETKSGGNNYTKSIYSLALKYTF